MGVEITCVVFRANAFVVVDERKRMMPRTALLFLGNDGAAMCMTGSSEFS